MDLERMLEMRAAGMIRIRKPLAARIVKHATLPSPAPGQVASEVRILELPRRGGYIVVQSNRQNGEIKIVESWYQEKYTLARNQFFRLFQQKIAVIKTAAKAPKAVQLALF